jgi:transcriptional regulator with XRE-family HTH domain
MGRRSSSRGLGGGGPLPPERLPANGQPDGADWREWMRDLGRRQRQLREFAGLSQEELARLAGVSQGSVSRLEIGLGLATPLLIVLKITAALVRELRRLDPAILSPELREALELQSALAPTRGALGFKEVPLTEGPELEELVRLYRESPARHRAGILSVLRAMVSGG